MSVLSYSKRFCRIPIKSVTINNSTSIPSKEKKMAMIPLTILIEVKRGSRSRIDPNKLGEILKYGVSSLL